jgi:peptide/nickel transport system substrate-binding protein
MLNKKWSLLTVVVLLMILVLAACSTPEAEVITIVETRVQEVVITVAGEEVVVTQIVETEVTRVVAEPTAEMEMVPKDLIVCQAQEPTTLYGNGGSMLAMTSILHALRVPFITNLSYGYQAGPGLVKLPSLADGDAEFVVVEVNTGDMVVDTAGDLVELTDADGFTITDAEGNEVVFDGTPVMMEQLVVRFEMAPLMWEDGEAVTADDSVYSFELNADPDTPAGKFTVDRTAEYVALDDSTTQWTAVPGYRDSTYFANFWTPYPRHQLGSYSAAELLEADESSRSPLSFGAFKLEEWIPGEAIIMSRNENYYLAGEGLPHLDSVTYKFIPDTNALMAQLLAGSCDIGTQDGMDVGQAPFLIEAENGGLLKPYFQTGTVFEHIDFNIDPWDRPERGGERTVWFDNVAVRQAMTMCTDRQSMVDNILYGRSEVIHTYIPSVHPCILKV